MATAKKLPSGQWRTLAYSHTETIDGKQKRIYESFTAPTKKEAEYMAAEFMLNKKRIHIGNLTFIEAAENYIADKENILSPSTIRGYKYIIKKETEDINQIPIKKIDEKLLQRFINNNSVKYSSKSISNQIGFISAVLKKYKIVLDFDSLSRKPKQKREILIPSENEVLSLLHISKGTTMEVPLILAALCGLRQSEIAGCTWDKLNGNILKIRGAVVMDVDNNYVHKQENKSISGTRDIILVDYASKRLNAIKSGRTTGSMSEMTPSGVLKGLKRLCRELGINEYSMHSLRHYHASTMLSLNIPDKYAMEILGQNSPHMLKTVYQHTFSSEFVKVNSIINEHYNNIMQHEMQHNKKSTPNFRGFYDGGGGIRTQFE